MDTQAVTKEMMGTFPLLFKLVFQPCGCDTPLPTTQMQALLLLSLQGPMNMTQLASRLMISKQQLTKIAEALVEKELIERVGHTANLPCHFSFSDSSGASLLTASAGSKSRFPLGLSGSVVGRGAKDHFGGFSNPSVHPEADEYNHRILKFRLPPRKQISQAPRFIRIFHPITRIKRGARILCLNVQDLRYTVRINSPSVVSVPLFPDVPFLLWVYARNKESFETAL